MSFLQSYWLCVQSQERGTESAVPGPGAWDQHAGLTEQMQTLLGSACYTLELTTVCGVCLFRKQQGEHGTTL